MNAKPYKIFIDGEAGTTGLQIRQRLEGRAELELLHLSDAERKDTQARAAALNAAEIAILCLPDDAARESVSLIHNDHTRVIDASVAHRVAEGWVYGFPEMTPGQTAAIAGAARVTNPGCYATGAVALIRPLVDAGVLPADHPVTVNAISGYTGGGKGLIARFEDPQSAAPISSAHFAYGLALEHKHVPEMRLYSGLSRQPLFVPGVGRFRQGMIVQVPLQLWSLPGAPKIDDIFRILSSYYEGRRFVTVVREDEAVDRVAFLDPEEVNHTNQLRLYIFGNPEHGQVVLAALLDNLGKGASGQAVQNLNIMLGLDEEAGLAPQEIEAR